MDTAEALGFLWVIYDSHSIISGVTLINASYCPIIIAESQYIGKKQEFEPHGWIPAFLYYQHI